MSSPLFSGANIVHFNFNPKAILFFGLISLSSAAHAATYTGNSAYDYDSNNACSAIHSDNGDFNDPKNWGSPCSPNPVPGPGETADLAGYGVRATAVNVGTLLVNGGGLTADSITVDNLNLSYGAVAGNSADASTLTVAKSVNWTGGHISSITATFAPACTATISGTNTSNTIEGEKILNGAAVLHNQGTINWSGDPISGFGGGSGTLDNSGTFNMLSDGSLGDSVSGYGITLVNSGLFDKTGGSGVTVIGAANGFRNNGGTVQAQTGIFDPSPAYSTTSFNGGTIAAGAGAIRQSSGTWILSGNMVVNGTLQLTGGAAVGTATFSGPGQIDWQGGGFGATYSDADGVYHDHSDITFAAGFSANISGVSDKFFGPQNYPDTGALTNKGLLTWSGPGNVSGKLKNQGTFNFLNDGALTGITIVNTGTLAKTGGSGTVTIGGHVLENSGTIDIQSGALELDYGQYSTDLYHDGSIIKGAGTLIGFANTDCDGTVNIDGTWQLGSDTSGSGLVVGGTFRGNGHLDWMGGTIGAVTFAPGFTVNVSGAISKGFSRSYASSVSSVYDTDSFIQGTLNWKGGAPLGLDGNPGSVFNTGTINVLAAGTFAGGKLTNQGTFNTFPGGTTSIGGTLLNSGTLNLGTTSAPGELSFSQTDFTNTGALNVGIAGTSAGQFSDLSSPSNGNGVTGIHLGGTLNINYADGFQPVDGNTFPIVGNLDRTGLDGTFQTVNGLTASNGRSLKVVYNPLNVTLELLPLPALSINSPSISEGNSGSKNLAFTAALSAPSSAPVTVKYATVNGTATAGKDYTSTSGTLTIAAGDTKGTINVPVIGDTLDETNETFALNLSSPTGATIATAQGIGTITDDDGTPTLKIGDISVKEGNSGTTTASYPVTLSAASGQSITVKYATADGTAKAPGDYTAANGTLTFAPGVTSQTVKVAVKGDTLDEANETFLVKLSSSTNASISDSSATGTITDDDAAPTLSINSPSITEGNSGTRTLAFTIKLAAASGQVVTVSAKTVNATSGNPATAGTDYIALAATKISFAVGEASKTVNVTIKGDTLDEADETFDVVLSSPTNATIGTGLGTGVGTILDDDATPSLSIANVSMAEGNSGSKSMVFTVTLSATSGRPVTVNFATSDLTATQGSDYTAQSGSLSFAAGTTSKTISVPVKGDTVKENDEQFKVTLSSPVGATLAVTSALGTITNDDSSVTTAALDPSAASS